MIRPNLQKDEDGNFVYYPCILFPKHGYLIPDEKTANKLDDSYLILIAFPILWLTLKISIGFLFIAAILYCIIIFGFRYKSVRKFSRSKRRFSWKYYANIIGYRRSKFVLYLVSFIMFCALGLPVFMIVDRPNITFLIGGLFLFTILLFLFFISLLAIYFKE